MGSNTRTWPGCGSAQREPEATTALDTQRRDGYPAPHCAAIAWTAHLRGWSDAAARGDAQGDKMRQWDGRVSAHVGAGGRGGLGQTLRGIAAELRPVGLPCGGDQRAAGSRAQRPRQHQRPRGAVRKGRRAGARPSRLQGAFGRAFVLAAVAAGLGAAQLSRRLPGRRESASHAPKRPKSAPPVAAPFNHFKPAARPSTDTPSSPTCR